MTAPKETNSAPPRPNGRPTAPVIDLKNRTTRESNGPASGFAAQIDGASMADLIQLECTRGLTRAIRVSAEEKTGFLYFDQGQLVHAIAGPLTGETAAREILTWEGGTVRPSDSYWIKPPTIHISWQALLITAAQAKDESNRSESEVFLRIGSHPPPPQGSPSNIGIVNEAQPLNDDSENGVMRLARLSSEGELLQGQGDLGDFPDAAAYCAQLAELIGQGLGLEEFSGLECTSADRMMLLYKDGSQIVALEADPKANLLTHRRKAGL